MLTVDIKENGRLIGHIVAVNQDVKGVTKAEWLAGWRAYEYEYTPYKTKGNRKVGQVAHCRTNGATALVKEICEDLEAKHGC